MLWLIIRSTFYFVLLAAAAWAATVLLETPGSVSVTWGGTTYAMRPLAAVFAAGVLFFGLWLLWKAVGLLVAVFAFFFTGDRTALERYWARRAQTAGPRRPFRQPCRVVGWRRQAGGFAGEEG